MDIVSNNFKNVLGKCPKNALAPPVPPKPIIIFFTVSILGHEKKKRRVEGGEGGEWGRIECQVDDEIFLRQHFGVVGHVLD